MPSRTKKRPPARSAVPSDFRGGNGRQRSQAQTAPAAPTSERIPLPEGWEPFKHPDFITERQWGFICDMLDKRDLLKNPSFFDAVNAMDADEYAKYMENLKDTLKRCYKRKASELIETLKALPYKERERSDKPDKKVPAVSAGRYALLSPDDELNPVRFYIVRDGKDKTEKGGKDWTGAKFVDRFKSDDIFPVKYRSAEYFRVLQEIAANPLEAAQRFGDEWEVCSQCGRGLTRRLSRKLRIGPVCLGRRPDWVVNPEAYVEQARAEIIAEGHDPNETLPRTKKRPPRRGGW